MLPDEILLLLCTKPASINCSSMLLLRLRSFKAFFILSRRALTMSSNDLESSNTHQKHAINALFQYKTV